MAFLVQVERNGDLVLLLRINKIYATCVFASEILENVLQHMKADTGVEPDEGTRNNIVALAQFLSDYSIYGWKDLPDGPKRKVNPEELKKLKVS